MKILVPTKRVPSTDEPVRVHPDGSGIDNATLTHMINPFDAIALEEALRIRERQGPGVGVVAVGIGSVAFESELRTALAMGADRALRIDCDDSVLDPWSVAQVLAAIVRREKPDLVLMGKQAVDDDSNQAGQILAGLLDWPQATFASKIQFLEPARLQVARETDRGLETVVIRLPAVVTTDLRLNEPRYASLPALMKARKRPIETVSQRELGVSLEPKVRIMRLEQAAVGRECVRVADVAELVRRLRYEAKVI
ncbi:MAG: electron transfer flavoprotein subunit beta/FixA family protein [Pedosphaera sp.]|nr:electron transfer flavoprotein subunit beta/FixA family protein [Pedosphaera sp.]